MRQLVRFTVAGEAQYSRAFEALEAEVADMRDPLGQIRDELVRSTAEQFDTEGIHGGLPWQPLDPTYAAWKEQHYPDAQKILVRSGAMRAAFLVDGTRELTERSLVWGITDQETLDDDGNPLKIAVYAQAHQTGAGVVPQRKIIALTEAEKRGWDRIFVTWLQGLRRRTIGANP